MAASVSIDELDRRIVALLQEDSRRTLADIGAHVNLSAPAVKRRIDRLQALRVIVRFTVDVDDAKLGRELDAFVELRFGGATPVDDITETAAGIEEVEAVFTMAGDPDALVWARVADIQHLNQVLDRLRGSGSVIDTKTLVVLGSWTRRSR